ncbi:MAG: flagellar biosynthesis protein FlhF [Kiritimatiellia bacterium]|jgi:flagellar biosynthesis protein FlhF
MQAKRFIAADMRRALDMVKEEFGEDAMIVSTERTAKGVELVASLEASFDHLINEASAVDHSASAHHQKIATAASRFQSVAPATTSVPLAAQAQASQRGLGQASGKTKDQLAEEMELANRKMLASRKAGSMTLEDWADQEWNNEAKVKARRKESIATETPEKSKRETVGDQEIKRLHDEIADMRNTLEIQLSQMAETQERQYQQRQYSESLAQLPSALASKDIPMPAIAEIKYQLDALGLPKACNDNLMVSIKEKNMPLVNTQRLWTHVLTELSRRIPKDLSDPVSTGGVYAFLGTTGVGKTTTIAKLAARYVMQHGPESIVILTTDTYRIASHNQLRSLAKILGVTVKVVDDLEQLPMHLATYKHYDLVLIDTPGMAYSDPMLKPHLHILRQCAEVKSALVLAANSQYQMMKASLHSYRLAGLNYCVLTKLDECANLGDAIGLLFEHDLPLTYTTDGQSVPEDIAVSKPAQLVARAVNMLKNQRKQKQVSS